MSRTTGSIRRLLGGMLSLALVSGWGFLFPVLVAVAILFLTVARRAEVT